MESFMDEKKYMRAGEASQYLGVSKSTLYLWARERKIPSLKYGRVVLFNRDEIDRWFDSKQIKAI